MNEIERDVCGAKKRLSKETCQAIPMKNGRCRIHGGKSLKGFAHPRFKNGLYSKYIYLPDGPSNMVETKDFIQMVASIYNIVTRHVDTETAIKIEKETERYFRQLYQAGLRF